MIWLALLRAYWKQLAIVLAILIGVHYWDAHVRQIQAAKDAGKIAALRTQLVTASNRLADAAAAFRNIAVMERANKAAADDAKRRGADELAQAMKAAAAHVKSLQADLVRQRKAYAGNVCAVQALPEGVK